MRREHSMAREKYFGKYRGFVVDNADPMNQARIKAQVPEVFGDEVTVWALPCIPFAGEGYGFYMIPDPGVGIWIEFEAGDPSRPIWSGGFWGADQIPQDVNEEPAKTPLKIIRSASGMIFSLDDENRTLILSGGKGSGQITIKVEGDQIRLKSPGKVVMEAPQVELVKNGIHPLVRGDDLIQYLSQLVSIYQSHLHPGEGAGSDPVIPSPPVPPMPPPTKDLL
jgi:hypothetical protein